ncbi:putative nucleotide-diphospho-sugar transferase [Polynucleobacter sp. MWH-UH23A]|uniref:putative nucleotide-diphospho-sugar transferase n=1 Tax=Polynucleobacter sp. MWH-UH23A TaxID=1855613 RepID=UPI0033650831
MTTASLAIVSGYVSKPGSGRKPRWLKSVKKNHQNYASKHGYAYIFREDFACSASNTSAHEPFYVGTWSKPTFILDLLNQGYEYVFWIDSDSIFTNFKIGFDDLIRTQKDLIFSGDAYDVCNAGHLLFRNSDFSKAFLEKWDETRFFNYRDSGSAADGFWITADGYGISDQANLNALLSKNIETSLDLLEGFNAINGYPENPLRKHRDWQKLYSPKTPNYCDQILRDLIRPDLHANVLVVNQRRLNAYPKSICGEARYQPRDPLVHFVSDTKDYLVKANIISLLLMSYGIYITPFIYTYPFLQPIVALKNRFKQIKRKMIRRIKSFISS